MNIRPISLSMLALAAAVTTSLVTAQVRVPDFQSITGAAVSPEEDLLWLTDTSQGNTAASSKKITIAELANVSSFTNSVESKASNAALSPAFGSMLTKMRRDVGAQATVFFIGDSMAHRIPNHLYSTLADRFPIAGYALDELFNKVTAGTVQLPGDNATPVFEPTLWDTGRVYQMSAGGQMEISRVVAGNQQKLLRFSRAILWCSKRPGGGTLTVEYQRDGSTWVSLGTLDTNGSLGDVARGEFNQTIYWSKLRITATGGPVSYIGAKLWRDSANGNGLILARSSTGGIRIDQSLQASSVIRSTIGADLGPGIIFPFYAEASSEIDQTELNQWISNWRTAMPTSDQVFVEQTGGPANTGDLTHIRELYKSAMDSYPFVNTIRTYDWLRGYNYTEAQDWNKSSQSNNPDAVHMRDETWFAMAGMIYNRAFAGYEPISTFGLTQRTGNSYEWTLGDDPPPNHHTYYNLPVDRTANSTFGLATRNSFGHIGGVFLNYYGTANPGLPQGAQLVLRTDGSFHTPVTFDSSSRVRGGPFSASPITATSLGAGLAWQEGSASFASAMFQNTNASAANNVIFRDSAGNVTARVLPNGTIESTSLQTGAITATGQVEATGQTAATNNSVMTRVLGDSRWLARRRTTTAPNDVVEVNGFEAAGGTTNIDVLLAPKGTGAILAQIPDNTITGGNKRGEGAVDFQTSRGAALQVASGLNSFIGGGHENTASGQTSVVVGGRANQATANGAFVAGGINNLANGIYSFASGSQADVKGSYGAVAFASGSFASRGDAQRVSYLLRNTTSDATQTELSMSGNTPGSTTRVVLGTNIVLSFRGQAVARRADGNVKAWQFSGLIKKDTSNASVQMIGPVTMTSEGNSAASAWVLTVDADTTNGSLRFQGTGAAATNIRWLVSVETAELGF